MAVLTQEQLHELVVRNVLIMPGQNLIPPPAPTGMSYEQWGCLREVVIHLLIEGKNYLEVQEAVLVDTEQFINLDAIEQIKWWNAERISDAKRR